MISAMIRSLKPTTYKEKLRTYLRKLCLFRDKRENEYYTVNVVDQVWFLLQKPMLTTPSHLLVLHIDRNTFSGLFRLLPSHRLKQGCGTPNPSWRQEWHLIYFYFYFFFPVLGTFPDCISMIIFGFASKSWLPWVVLKPKIMYVSIPY